MDPFTAIFIAVATLAVSFGITALMQPKATKPKPATLEEFEFPQHEEDIPQTVIFGDVWQDGWEVLWWGNLRTQPIKK